MTPPITVSEPPVPAEAFEKHPGEWVAIRDGQIIAAAESVEGLEQNDAVEPTDTIFLVPDPSTHFYRLRRA